MEHESEFWSIMFLALGCIIGVGYFIAVSLLWADRYRILLYITYALMWWKNESLLNQ